MIAGQRQAECRYQAFIGRKTELEQLQRLRKKATASLVCVMGRRRIGKSTLIDKFGQDFESFLVIQGLGPDLKPSNQDQLDHFARTISLTRNVRQEHFTDWTEALYYLGQLTATGEQLILLDEISWLGRRDPLFASKLKDAWDLYLKKNPHLILVLCGSVSAWIEENLLNNANFEGRISSTIRLGELTLPEINSYWSVGSYTRSDIEKIMILSVTGGVPKYLEEVLAGEDAERNVIELCFRPGGLLFQEYDQIFSTILAQQSSSLEKIVRSCLEKKLTPSELAQKLDRRRDGVLSKQIHVLEISGFLSRDYYFKFDGNMSKLSQLRVKDNYLRFYLKYIEPNRARILKGGKTVQSLSELVRLEQFMGYQFENLILANRELIYPFLGIDTRAVVSAAPYVQRAGVQPRMVSCQVDLLINSALDVVFLCELKCRRTVDRRVIVEVERKMRSLKLPRRFACKPVLIYAGELAPAHEEEIQDFFYRAIPFEHLLKAP